MKKSNLLLSILMVPTLILQGGQTCTSGGGSEPNIPVSVTGVQTYNKDASFTFTVSSANGSVNPSTNTLFTLGGTYSVWCTLPTGLVPGGGVNPDGSVATPEGPNGGVAQYTPYNYSSYSVSSAGGSFGVAGNVYDTATSAFDIPLTLAQEWNAVNWILNFPNGSSGEKPTPTDIQSAIWQLLNSGGLKYVTTVAGPAGAYLTPASAMLYNDALAHISFVPGTGGVVGVLMVPTTPSGSATYQGFVVPVPIPCTATGSATLTKTASASIVNAFQTITYTYTVKNTGATTLQNIVIVDDNGTPAYTEDDVTIPVPGTLAPGASYSVKSAVYLPISLFYQSGSSASFDTLIPQIPASPANALLLTYLIDSDVTDNTYGTGAAAGWAGVGGHTFSQELGNYAEFALYDSRGNLVSDFNADYLSSVGVSSTFPSGYGSGLQGAMIHGNSKYIDYITSTLADNLNGYAKFYSDTVNSPVGDLNWQTISGYKVIVDKGAFGLFGMGSAAVKKNYLTTTETAFAGKCGYSKSVSFTPQVVSSKVTGTAYLCAQVCGCSTIVHARATTCVTLNGCAQPKCSTVSAHDCQAPKCACTCAQCKAGNHTGCSHVGCTDPICHASNCNHNTITCKTTNQTYTW